MWVITNNSYMEKRSKREVYENMLRIGKEGADHFQGKASDKKKEMAKKIKISHKGDIGHVVESIGPGGKVTSVKKHGTKDQLKKLGY